MWPALIQAQASRSCDLFLFSLRLPERVTCDHLYFTFGRVLKLGPHFRNRTPGTPVFIRRAKIHQVAAGWNQRQWFTRYHHVEPLGRRVVIEDEPVVTLVGLLARPHLHRHVRFDPILSLVQSGVRINHLRLTSALGMKHVEVAVDTWFKRDPNTIAAVKFVPRLYAHAASTGVPHEERITKP